MLQRDAPHQNLLIHPVVQAVLKDEMEPALQRQWAERAVRAVNRCFPVPEFSTWPLCERLLPQALACATLVQEWIFVFSEAARLLNRAAVYLVHRGRYTKAEPLHQRALAIREQTLGPAHRNVAQSLNSLAVLYRHQGRYSEAKPLFQRALAIREQTLGPAHRNVAQSLNNLAELYRLQGHYTEAEPFAQRALAVREQSLGPDHPAVAIVLDTLASLYRDQGRHAGAGQSRYFGA